MVQHLDQARHHQSHQAQAPLRLISWCSFELDNRAKTLLRHLAVMCESATTSTQQLIDAIAQCHANVRTEQEAIEYLASLATVQIASRAQMPSYTTMVQHFLGTLKLPMAIYMLDYYLPMLSPNDGYNETGLTMQKAGPVRQEWQPVQLSYLYKGSEFGHWKVYGGQDTFAFRHPSLAQADVQDLLESEAHHHKICPVGAGRLIAMVGTAPIDDPSTQVLQVLFGLVLTITPCTSKSKNDLPAVRIHRQCNPKSVEVAFLTLPAVEFFAADQFQVLHNMYIDQGYGIEPVNATIRDEVIPLPETFLLKDIWMFGITKSTSELTAVTQTPLCRYQPMCRLQSMAWTEVRDPISCRCVGNFYGASTHPAPHQDRVKCLDPDHCPVLCCRDGWTCARHALRGHNGPPNQST